MELRLSQARVYIAVLSMAIVFLTPANAQTGEAANYLQRAGDYADLYNGKMEATYSNMLYDNFPYYSNSEYYENSDFTDATIVYHNIYYPNQKVRLDLYKDQLILLPPEKRFGIIVNSQNVEKVSMYNETFVRLTPSKESGLKPGYYLQLLDKENMQLLCRIEFILQKPQPTLQQVGLQRLANNFTQKKQYYLLYNNQYNKVKDKGSLSKLFPHFKKQINKYSKEHSLNFKKNAKESLTALAGYCEELLTPTNKK